MNTLIAELKKRIKGQVLSDPEEIIPFSRDQSIYCIMPLAVVIPKDFEDIRNCNTVAAENGISITCRGGGSGTAGANLGRGIIIAFKNASTFSFIEPLNSQEHTKKIKVGSAVVHSQLQKQLAKEGFFLPADPSSSSLCLIGGNIATKASGPHELNHGSIDRYLDSLSFIDCFGTLIDTSQPDSIPQRISDGLRDLHNRIQQDAHTLKILTNRKNTKIASGYNLFPLINQSVSLSTVVSQLLVGSVGSLGVITAATLIAEPLPEGRSLVVIPFHDLFHAADAAMMIRELTVAALEIISKKTIHLVKQKRSKAFASLPEAVSSGNILIIECEGPERYDQIERIKKLLREKKYPLNAEPLFVNDFTEQSALWNDRKQLLTSLLHFNPTVKALSVVNDIGIDPQYLAHFITDAEKIFHDMGLESAIYGHAGSGNLHLRPLFPMNHPDLKTIITKIADQIYEKVFLYKGTITAEHGMGRLRAPYLSAEWGDTIVGYMKHVKDIFDPLGLFDPCVMFSKGSITDDMCDT